MTTPTKQSCSQWLWCLTEEKEEKEKSRIPSLFFFFLIPFVLFCLIPTSRLLRTLLYIGKRIMRRLLLLVRKYSNLFLWIICTWMFIYIYQEHSNRTLSITKTDNNTIYSYFKAQVYNNARTISTRDVLLVVRTSKNTQSQRMPVILRTWFQFSPYTTYITTNGERTFFDRHLSKEYHQQIYVSQCKQAHSIRDLCCNSAVEFDIYFKYMKQYKWLCRFDDDQYVNVPLLIDFLDQFSPEKESLYIGKPSMKEPKRGRGLKFWFATYGGGVCFSKYLLKKIRSHIQPSDRFIDGCVSSNYPDDTHIAYLLRKEYNINLTIANDFHHHIELLQFINLTHPSTLDQAITFGFKGNNVPPLASLFNSDTYHMQTLHCVLYPDRECLRLIRILLNKLYEGKQP